MAKRTTTRPAPPIAASPAPPLHDSRVPQVVAALLGAYLVWTALTKAFHVDDTLFVRSAQAWVEHGDPLAFTVNWSGTAQPAHTVMLNPPAFSALLAAAGLLLGWSEAALHTASLLALALFAWAVLRLSRVCSVPGAWSVALALAAPAFAVSATTVMPDVSCAALLTLGVAEWCDARADVSWRRGLFAAVLIALAALTKYAGLVALVPCLAWTFSTRAKRGALARGGLLLLPIAAVIAYDAWQRAHYGASAFGSALSASRSVSHGGLPIGLHAVVALAFTGGASCAGLVWLACGAKRAGLALGACVATALLLVVIAFDSASVSAVFPTLVVDREVPVPVAAQCLLFCGAGVAALTLMFRLAPQLERAQRLVIWSWLAAGMLYGVVLNWDISARGCLPWIPPLCVAAAAAVAQCPSLTRRRCASAVLVASALVSVLVVRGDAEFAAQSRDEARAIFGAETHGAFLGHWGFQHYAEAAGATALGRTDAEPAAGTVVAVPMSASVDFALPSAWSRNARERSALLSSPLVTLGPRSGAGFYAGRLGPLPFALNRDGALKTWVITVP